MARLLIRFIVHAIGFVCRFAAIAFALLSAPLAYGAMESSRMQSGTVTGVSAPGSAVTAFLGEPGINSVMELDDKPRMREVAAAPRFAFFARTFLFPAITAAASRK
jgi:hypothetical protein